MLAPEKSRLAIGIDVPWVTSWTAEEISVGTCPSVGGQVAVVQGERPQHGRPVYSRNHFRRQRESIRRMLCPMCGRPAPSGDRWTQTGKYLPAGVLRARGLADSIPAGLADKRIVLDAGAIAPGHLACMTRSLDQCPHLRDLDDRELKPFPDRWQITPMLIEATVAPPAAGPGAVGAPRSILVIGFLQLCGVTNGTDKNWRRMLAGQPG